MIKDWNVNKIISDCHRIYVNATDPHLTGFVNWPCKQDLYRIKFAVEEMLEKTSTFVDEEAWLNEQKIEQEKKQVWRSLNEVQNLP